MYEITYLNLEENAEYEEIVKKEIAKCYEEENLLESK